MNPAMVIGLGQEALKLTMFLSGPMLISGLLIGLIVGIFQAVTQIHEMTLTFVPKILIVGFSMLLALPWMINKALDFFIRLFEMIPMVVK
ncbi:MAG: flagellar biosynthesis protein FliQ [Fibrobacterota bacterium]